MNPDVKFVVIRIAFFPGRLQVLTGAIDRLNELIQRRFIQFRRSMRIKPATRTAESTFHTLGQKSIEVGTVATVSEVYFPLNDPARIHKQFGRIGYERPRVTGRFGRHRDFLNNAITSLVSQSGEP